MYQRFVKKPWYFSGKRVIKPHMASIRKRIHVTMPIESSPSMPSNMYKELHTSTSIIAVHEPTVAGFSICFSYLYQYHGRPFRTFAVTQEDAVAWLIVHALVEEKNIILWNAELTYKESLNVMRLSKIKRSQAKRRMSNLRQR